MKLSEVGCLSFQYNIGNIVKEERVEILVWGKVEFWEVRSS